MRFKGCIPSSILNISGDFNSRTGANNKSLFAKFHCQPLFPVITSILLANLRMYCIQ